MPSPSDNRPSSKRTVQPPAKLPAAVAIAGRAPDPAPARIVGCVLALLVLCLGGAGCAYSLGPTNGQHAGTHSIQVAPFHNRTIEPRLTDAVTSAIRKQLQQ